MKVFEFEWEGNWLRFRFEMGDLIVDAKYPNGHWYKQRNPSPVYIATAFRALLANRAELVALYREAMEWAREINASLDELHADTAVFYTPKLDALDARAKVMGVEG